MIKILFPAILLACLASAPAVAAHVQRSPIFGAWQCNQFCQASHRVATISAERSSIECRNETGMRSIGQLVSDRAFNCFNTAATLSDDGETIVWSNGTIWRRDHLQEF
jgi:hypothetical protein